MNLIARVTAMSRPTFSATISMPGQRISTIIVLAANSSQRNKKMTRHPLGPFSCSFGLLKYLPAIYRLLLRPQFYHPCPAEFCSRSNAYILKHLERNSPKIRHCCSVPLGRNRRNKTEQKSAFPEAAVTTSVTFCHFPHSHTTAPRARSRQKARTTLIHTL